MKTVITPHHVPAGIVKTPYPRTMHMQPLTFLPPHRNVTSPKPMLAYPIILSLAFIALTLIPSSLRASDTDERIEAAAKSSYVFKTHLKDDDIRTTALYGVVTLTGSVSDESHKTLAQETVAVLPGVRRVDNQLRINAASVEHSDTWLYLRIKNTLAFHRSVSAIATKVDVKNGIVTLKGEAANDAQKELTTQYAQDVDGVKAVHNQMTLAAVSSSQSTPLTEMIDDASITAQVRVALLMHSSTSAFKTTVSTTDGIVTVGGKAKNTAEIALVTKLVSDINGVKSVVNTMTIEIAVSAK